MSALRSENNFNFIRLVAVTIVIITHSYAVARKGEGD